ncbi:MAG TPA: hypothetical protein VMF65_22960 [Acidimicrobiales bacterium]|nr:hypothetical protein [Acidimicrobiales bacterium]
MPRRHGKAHQLVQTQVFVVDRYGRSARDGDGNWAEVAAEIDVPATVPLVPAVTTDRADGDAPSYAGARHRYLGVEEARFVYRPRQVEAQPELAVDVELAVVEVCCPF